MLFQIPVEVQEILNCLEQAGYEAYLVGGCIRDCLIGKVPQDWDITTSAQPEQVISSFPHTIVLPTGLRHGTVSVRQGGMTCEVTSYRTEFGVSDGRHPRVVQFGCSLEEDLKRRDFTVNAMAYHPQKGLIDLFGGQKDLEKRLIRCVGDPDLRFQEDALRILRAMRFASVYGFSIQRETACAIHRNYALLGRISVERVLEEFRRFLIGKNPSQLLREFSDVAGFLFPELEPSFGFEQKNPHHSLDIWEHTLKALEDTPPDYIVRMAVLLHDSGKPNCFTEDQAGIGHFYGHNKCSSELAESCLKRLRCDKESMAQIILLVRWHDAPLETQRQLLRMLNRLGEPLLRKLLLVKRADLRAHAPADIPLGEERLRRSEQLLNLILTQHVCFSLRDLAINGEDLLQLGFSQGPLLGSCLKGLLGEVLEGRLENQKEVLLAWAIQFLQKAGG